MGNRSICGCNKEIVLNKSPDEHLKVLFSYINNLYIKIQLFYKFNIN